MAKYSAEVTTTLTYTYVVDDIEADSEEEAKRFAMDSAQEGDVDEVLNLGEWNHEVEIEESDCDEE